MANLTISIKVRAVYVIYSSKKFNNSSSVWNDWGWSVLVPGERMWMRGKMKGVIALGEFKLRGGTGCSFLFFGFLEEVSLPPHHRAYWIYQK